MAFAEFIAAPVQHRAHRSVKRFWFGVADAFFRKWPLYVLPLVLLTGLGVLQAKAITGDYRSVAVLNVSSNPLLTDVTPLNNTGTNNFETPSAATARTLNELMRTDTFVRSIAQRAGLGGALQAQIVTLDDIRGRVGAGSDGERLLSVRATWSDGTTAAQLVNATIGEYTDHVLELEVKQSKEAEQFWTQLMQTYQQRVDTAQKHLQDYVVQFPAPRVGDRPTEQQLKITELSNNVSQAQAQVTNAENKIQEAKLATQQATGQIGEGLQVVDAAEVPNAPEPIRRKQALTGAIFVFLGIFVMCGMLLLAALLDRAIRSADDVDRAAGLAVVATVPNLRVNKLKSERERRKRRLAKA